MDQKFGLININSWPIHISALEVTIHFFLSQSVFPSTCSFLQGWSPQFGQSGIGQTTFSYLCNKIEVH